MKNIYMLMRYASNVFSFVLLCQVLTIRITSICFAEAAFEPTVTFVRPDNAGEDNVDVLIDSFFVAEIELQAITAITVSPGIHWVILRYGKREFLNNKPSYRGIQLEVTENSETFFKMSYRSWADMFFNLNLEKISQNEVDVLQKDSVLEYRICHSDNYKKQISSRKYKKILDGLIKESVDSSTVKISPDKLSIRIPESLQGDSNAVDQESTLSPEDVNVGIRKATRMRAFGIPLMCIGMFVSGVAYSLILPKIIGLSDVPSYDQKVLIGFSGLPMIAGGIVLNKIGKSRLKKLKGEYKPVSMNFFINDRTAYIGIVKSF